jgi:hypothetical protein
MAIVPPKPGFDPSPFAVGYPTPQVADSASRPGLLESTAISASLGFFGTIGRQTIPAVVDSFLFSNDEPGYDPYSNATDEYFQSHPYMVKPFMNGQIDGIHNSGHFAQFEDRQREDWQLRQRLGEASTGVSLASGLLGYVPDAVLGGALLKGLGLAGRAEALAESAASSLLSKSGRVAGNIEAASANLPGAIKNAVGVGVNFIKGGSFERVAKIALAGGVSNLAYDQSIRAVSTNRNIEDERIQALEQFGMGVAFSAALLPVLGGIGKLGHVIPTARLEAMRQSLAEAVSSLDLKSVAEQSAADIAAATEALKTNPPRIAPPTVPAPGGINLDAATFMGTAGTVPAGKQYFTILRDPNNPQAFDNFKNQAWATHGRDNVVFLDHPEQFLIDHADEIGKLQPIELGPVGKTVVSALRLINPVATSLERTPSMMARRTSRMLWDFSLATQESFDDPMTFQKNPPAEALQWTYHKYRDDTLRYLHESFGIGVQAKESYTFANGKTVQFSSKWTDRKLFGEAVTDFFRQEDLHRRGWGNAPVAPASVKRAADGVRAYFNEMGNDMVSVGMLDSLGREYYGTRRYHQRAIIDNRESVVERLVKEQGKYRERDYGTGQRLVPDDRKLEVDAVKHDRHGRMKQTDIAGTTRELGLHVDERTQIKDLAATLGKEINELTEFDIRKDLGQDVLDRYLEEITILHEERARKMVDNISDMANGHGVRNGFVGGRATHSREVQMDETLFSDVLDSDAFGMVNAYSHVISGQLAARRAVMADAKFFDKAVKEATGKSLAQHDHDPRAVFKAVQKNFQDWIDALNRNGKASEAAKMADTMEKHLDLMERKLRELEGSPVFANDPSAATSWNFGRFAGRQLLKFPFMASMGKMAIGNLTDIAALSLYKGMTPERRSVLAQAMNFIKEFPDDRSLEGFFVATSDISRNLFTTDFGDIVNYSNGDTPFGPGKIGKMMSWTDRATDKMAQGFTQATGIRRVSSNLKRAAAVLVQREVIEGARRMVDARELMVTQGLSQEEAFAKVGMTAEDASRLNRLGMNLNRSRRLTDMLDQYAVDREGNRVDSRHKGWMSAETSQWHKQDRDLFDAFNYAVNTEVLDLIVEPKIMSRPLLNNLWIGRAINQFQSFAMAWGNQFAPMIAQRPAYEAVQYAMAAVGFGILTDAAYNQISGRRSLAESASMVTENPLGLIYGGVSRSPLLGWLARPIGMLESTPYGVGKALGNKSISSQYARPEITAGDVAGPVFGWADNIIRAVSGIATDGYNDSRGRRLWRSLPFHNWFVLDALNRTAEAAGYDTLIGPRPVKPR